MADLSLEWNSDFVKSSTGDLELADGDTLSRQRITRRLFQATKAYIFHLEFGAGLPQRVGDPISLSLLRALVVSQLGMETSVSKATPPKVTVTYDGNNPGLYIVQIDYVSQATGNTVSFNLSV